MGHVRSRASGAGAAIDLETAERVAAVMQGLASPVRLQLLAMLRSGPRAVGDLTQELDLEQSAVSHQLKVLRELHLVVAQREGRHVHYRLFDDHLPELLEQAVWHVEHLDLSLPD